MKRVASLLLTLALCLGLVLPAGAAGTIFGLPLSQQFDNNGKPLVGARLYIYEANTSTPATAYEDFGLTNTLPWPLEADATGRLPEFWLDDGDYRARLTTNGGIVQFDIQSVTALGPSSGEGGGGGGVADDQIATTGDLKWRLSEGSLSGWVRLNGRTIGSVSSGATERANADTQSLYEYLYGICDNSDCPVIGGRGSSATDDFEANKPITLPDLRGRSMVAFDDMGNTAAGVLAGATTPFADGGAEKQSIGQTHLPNYTLPNTLSVTGSQTVILNRGANRVNAEAAHTTSIFVAGENNVSFTIFGSSFGVGGGVFLGGGGNPLSVKDPYMPGSIYIKL